MSVREKADEVDAALQGLGDRAEEAVRHLAQLIAEQTEANPTEIRLVEFDMDVPPSPWCPCGSPDLAPAPRPDDEPGGAWFRCRSCGADVRSGLPSP